ncbi:MAG: 4Fe-4S dicluster domain-containing protein [Candidatus Thorarchaeota archaeon]|jgi:Fe-S-cluster-containing hydrogenase component 2
MITVDISKCTGCRSCETACSFFHTGKVSNRIARIKVMHIYETGVDGPVVCQQCEERYCLDCPVDALSIGEEGQIIASPTICNQCGACERNCPIGAIELFNDIVYVCDLCGGRPSCIEECTESAISYHLSSEKPSLTDFKNKTKDMNPSEKRQFYIELQSQNLRRLWREKLA